MSEPKVKLIDYKNVRVSLISSVVCFFVSNILAVVAIGTSVVSVKDNFTVENFDAELRSLAWVNRLADTFNILFFITLVYLLAQIAHYYKSQSKK